MAAIVIGVPGAGKSRLLAEARRLAPEFPVLTISGYESERQVPLAAAGTLLRELARVPGHGKALDALLVGRAGEPGIDERSPDGDPLEPLRIFEAAHRALQAIGSALLIVDDLHWVDELSRSLCHFLVRGAAEMRQPLVVLAATRLGVEAQSLLDSLPSESIRIIDLGPLNLADGLQLVRSLDPALDETAAAGLYTQAQGIPFWLEGLARYGRSPGGLEQVLTRRLRGAGAEAATVLGALALAGRPLPLAEAANLLELPPERVTALVEALGERGLVTTAAGTVQPAHDLVRTTAAAQIPEELRRTIHARLAASVEADAGRDLRRLHVALDHRRAAGLPLVALAIKIAEAPDRRLLGPDGLETIAMIASTPPTRSPPTRSSFMLRSLRSPTRSGATRRPCRAGRWSRSARRNPGSRPTRRWTPHGRPTPSAAPTRRESSSTEVAIWCPPMTSSRSSRQPRTRP